MTAKDVRRKKLLRTLGLHFSGVDTLKALGMYLMSVMGCLLLRSFDMHNDTSYVAMIFLLDVFLTAFWTDGICWALSRLSWACSAWTTYSPIPSGTSALPSPAFR